MGMAENKPEGRQGKASYIAPAIMGAILVALVVLNMPEGPKPAAVSPPESRGAEAAEELVRGVLAKHHKERLISLLGISVSNLERCPVMQLELSFACEDEKRRPGSRQGMARRVADGAIDKIRDRFGWKAVAP